MYYTNYLLNNIPSLLKVETTEDQNKFLGVSFNYKGYDWSACVTAFCSVMNLPVEGSL